VFLINISHFDIIRNIFLYERDSAEAALECGRGLPYCSLPVVSTSGCFIGLISIRALLREKPTAEKRSLAAYIKKVTAFSIHDNPLSYQWQGSEDILPITDENNQYIGFVSMHEFYRILNTEYKSMAAEYSQILNSTYNGIIVINTEGQIVIYNSAAERILGKSRAEIYGKHMSVITDDGGLMETLETGQPSVGVKTLLNGYSIITNRTPLMDDAGHVVGAMGVFIDVSDLDRVSLELQVNKALASELNAIIESSYDGLYIADREGKVIRVNSSWEKICGFSRQEILGKTAKELVTMGLYDNSAALLALEKRETSTVMLEITSGPKKGQRIIATGTPVFAESGDLDLVVVNVRDITALEHLKAQLDETRELSRRYANELNEIRLQCNKFDDIVVKSRAMQKVIEMVIRVSQVDSTIIITGESGVGKEVIAQKIHLLSNRKDHSLIKINCGAIPENLLESELFGYEGGAFTGARKDGKIGMFELASGGTLLLDEIGDLSLNLQVKLLRVLQEREIVRVGGIKTIKIDTRIIAATNKDLALMVRQGSFREDLFYRLNVVNIKIPPLRNRKEDLPPLINMILHRLNTKYHRTKHLSSSVIERLYLYDWPGNIRELENTLERVIVLAYEDVIQLEHLPDFLQNNEIKIAPVILKNIVPLKTAIEETECQLLKKALKEYGTTRKVAKVLEVNQSTIVRKMQQYHIDKDDAEEHQEDAYAHLLRI
jgi:PAS domain S-box-containing protein